MLAQLGLEKNDAWLSSVQTDALKWPDTQVVFQQTSPKNLGPKPLSGTNNTRVQAQ